MKDDIRKFIADYYTDIVRSGASCCGPVTSGCCGSFPAGQDAKTPYKEYQKDVGGLYHDVITSSFGCGNPLSFSEVLPGQVVLDLGCGAGLDLLIAAEKVGPTGQVIGVDMTDEMIERAKKNAAKAGFSNIDVRKGYIEDLPVDNESVDWVISNCVINLSPDKDKVFREIARVLRPNGRVSIFDIVARDLPDWVRTDMEFYASCIAGAISEEEYLEGLCRAGLADVQVMERLPYEPVFWTSLESSINSQCCSSSVSCCTGPVPDLKVLADEMKGKVWSARFYARKPV